MRTKSDASLFRAITGNADGWASVADLVELCDQAGLWSSDFHAQATLRAKKAHVRRMIRSMKDEQDWPIWASVESLDEDGRTVRVYKQETLFDIKDYRKVVEYHKTAARHHGKMARGYSKRCKRRFNVQLELGLKE